MLILTLRTDKPEAELGLFEGADRLAYSAWQAHRQLAETIHQEIKGLLESQQKSLQDIEGIIVFKGPGSFTGLRIGVSIANALAESLRIPIMGAGGEKWLTDGITSLQHNENQRLVLPEYGSPPHITAPKH